MLENDRSHSQEVIGRVAKIFNTTLIFSKEGKLIADIVCVILSGATKEESVDSTLSGVSTVFDTQYLSQSINSLSIAFGFGKSSS